MAEVFSEINNGLNISVKFKPFTDGLYSLNSLQFYEEIGGLLPYGKAEFLVTKYEPAKVLMTKSIEGTIIITGPKSTFEIPVIITSRQTIAVKFLVNFIVAPSISFYTEKKVETFDNINDAMSTLTNAFKNKNISVKSNVNPSIRIYKDYSTRYNFLKKLAQGYKNNTVFGFSINGFFIKKIKADSITANPILLGLSHWQVSSYNNLALNKNQDNNNPNITTEEDSNVLPSSSNYKIVDSYNTIQCFGGGGYEELGKNYIKNSTFIQNAKTNTIKITNYIDIPTFKLGDNIVTVDRIVKEDTDKNIKKRTNLVWSNEFFIRFEGSDFKSKEGKNYFWTSTLVNLDNAPWSNTK